MGLLDDVKDFASKHKSEKDGDVIDQAEKYIGEERLGQIKKKVGEENFDKYEHKPRTSWTVRRRTTRRRRRRRNRRGRSLLGLVSSATTYLNII